MTFRGTRRSGVPTSGITMSVGEVSPTYATASAIKVETPVRLPIAGAIEVVLALHAMGVCSDVTSFSANVFRELIR